MPFWKKTKPSSPPEVTGSSATDDLAALQKQFGIKTISTTDVQAELNQLLHATGSNAHEDALDTLLTTEEDDEESKILRAIGLSSAQLDTYDDPDALLRSLIKEEQTPPPPPPSVEGIPRTNEQVTQLKRQAVQLKREGKIKEAMEVLREAKTLEHSVPRASVQTRASTADGQPEVLPRPMKAHNDEVEVSEDDMKDPEYLAQLSKLGFRTDENEPPFGIASDETVSKTSGQNPTGDRDSILQLKRQAVQLKREGNVKAALDVLRQIRLLEQGTADTNPRKHSQEQVSLELPPLPSETNDGDVEVTDEDMNDPEYLSQLSALGFDMASTTRRESDARPCESMGPLSEVVPGENGEKESIREKIVQLKRQVVQLKRQGKTKAALDLLREVKVLEQHSSAASKKELDRTPTSAVLSPLTAEMKEEDGEVTDEDMNDPEYLSQLTQLGFGPLRSGTPQSSGYTTIQMLQSQILDEKTQAVNFKRQSNTKEAIESLPRVKELESQLALTRSSTPPREVCATVPSMDATEPLGVSVEEQLVALVDRTRAPSSTSSTVDQECNETHLQKLSSSTIALDNVFSAAQDELIDEFEDEDEDSAQPQQEQGITQGASVDEHNTQPVANLESTDGTDLPSGGGVEKDKHPSFEIADLETQLQRTKETAVLLKRQGRTSDAISMMRRVKQIETLITMKREKMQLSDHKASVAVAQDVQSSPHVLQRNAKFDELEKLLVDFCNRSMTEARELLKSDRAQASVLVEQRKKYVSDLETLRRMRLDPNQNPPVFAVNTQVEQKEYVQPNIADDEIQVTVTKVSGLSSSLNGHSIFVSFCLNVPSQNPHQGKTAVVTLVSGGASFASTPFKFKLQRTRGIQRLFELRKATFEVWKPATFLRNAEMVARTYQELSPLLSACEIRCRLPFVGPNRKRTGASVTISISLRTPLREREMRQYKREVLVMGPYPPTSQISAVPTPPSGGSTSSPPTTDPPHTGMAFSGHASPQDGQIAPDSEFEDPHNVEIIISYDVINEELERIQTRLDSLSSAPSLSPAAMELTDRFDSLSLKKQLLEIEMQTGKLTLDAYVARLNSRIALDRALIKRLLASGRRSDAAIVLRRVNIMQKELQGTDESSPES